MKNFLQVFIVGTFIAVIAAIVFVRAGQKSGVSGGKQASDMISAAGSSYAQGVTALEAG